MDKKKNREQKDDERKNKKNKKNPSCFSKATFYTKLI